MIPEKSFGCTCSQQPRRLILEASDVQRRFGLGLSSHNQILTLRDLRQDPWVGDGLEALLSALGELEQGELGIFVRPFKGRPAAPAGFC